MGAWMFSASCFGVLQKTASECPVATKQLLSSTSTPPTHFGIMSPIDKDEKLSWQQTLTPLIKAPGIWSWYLHQVYPFSHVPNTLRKPLTGSYWFSFLSLAGHPPALLSCCRLKPSLLTARLTCFLPVIRIWRWKQILKIIRFKCLCLDEETKAQREGCAALDTRLCQD